MELQPDGVFNLSGSASVVSQRVLNMLVFAASE